MQPTMTFSKTNKFIRLVRWAWGIGPTDLTFCKLVWGTLFLPLGALILRPFVFVATKLDDAITRRERAKRAAAEPIDWEARWREQDEKRDAKLARAAKLNRILGRIEDFFNREWLRKVVRYVGLLLGCFIAGLVAAVAVWAIIAEWQLLLGLVLGIFVAMLVIAGIHYLAVRFSPNFRKFSAAVGHGYHSVKYRTCPKIELN